MRTEYTPFADSLFCRASLAASRLSRCSPYAALLVGALIIGACHNCGTRPAPSEPNTAPAASGRLKGAAFGHGPPAKSHPQAALEDATLTPTEMSLFDGKTLGHWQITDFGGQGKVYVKDGVLFLEQGNDMTGVTWAGPLVRMSYEITLDAMRVSGSDFFCGLTFPVNKDHCSLILGGWGGSVCGLSNIDYYDAANNETTRVVSFENGRWYHVRLRVTPNRIQAWLDQEEEPLVDMDITGRKIDTRIEVDLSQPLGIATWQTAGAIRNIRLQKLAD